MEWKIKKFNELSPEELYKIIRLRIEVFVIEQNCIYQDCDGKDLNAYHLYLKKDGNVIACLRILNRGVSYDEVSIGRVVVKKDYRGRGIAKEMLRKAINLIENEMKENKIRISAQAYLENFYGSFGFKKVSDVYLEDGIPHVEMLYISESEKRYA
ncbi:MAG TPA: GNAT family N-acetyltransferase [Clostridiaceae bacterium]|nr:GNAT family N-acetyltransferase [Clostridiaceae bacterium]